MISAQNTNIHIMGRNIAAHWLCWCIIAALITARQVTKKKKPAKISGMLLKKKVII